VPGRGGAVGLERATKGVRGCKPWWLGRSVEPGSAGAWVVSGGGGVEVEIAGERGGGG